MANSSKGYRRLDAWQSSMKLVGAVREISRTLPDDDRKKLTKRMQRISATVPRTLARGFGRGGKEYRQYVLDARESLSELESQMQAAVRLGYLRADQASAAGRSARDTASRLNCLAMSLELS
ncbi:hypothetical protein KOR34_35640 [Posidoniimonas corsicana]|uniref:Four helix bundle protein n=1 Tax=Posidoniimonas corsicana TaxID=1938618 RepID=A0A5C5V5Z8_9BACT|nr:four helix bundle protein [Posidoniimonas corsicana]TWT33731.1 hypothetical protein KOR34_35640 [Posidoniimonas corsicana]